MIRVGRSVKKNVRTDEESYLGLDRWASLKSAYHNFSDGPSSIGCQHRQSPLSAALIVLQDGTHLIDRPFLPPAIRDHYCYHHRKDNYLFLDNFTESAARSRHAN